MTFPAQGQDPHWQHTGVSGHPPVGGSRPPRRTSRGVVVAIVVLAVLAVGGAVTSIVLATSGNGGRATATTSTSEQPVSESTRDTAGEAGGVADPRALAEEYVAAVNDADRAAATELTCGQTDPGLLFDLSTTGSEVVIHGELKHVNESYAIAYVSYRDYTDVQLPLSLVARAGAWCVER